MYPGQSVTDQDTLPANGKGGKVRDQYTLLATLERDGVLG